jgi:hypothetical protein
MIRQEGVESVAEPTFRTALGLFMNIQRDNRVDGFPSSCSTR